MADLDKNKKGIATPLSFPEQHEYKLCESIFSELSIHDLKTDKI